MDVSIASNILILIHAPLPTNPLYTLLQDSYPGLLKHSERILDLAFPKEHYTGERVHSPAILPPVPFANPIIQLGRSIHRTLQNVLPVAT